VQSCLEYEQFGFNRRDCQSWKIATKTACDRYCGNCTKIAEAVKDICKFTLQFLNNGPLSVKFCKESEKQFKDARCSIGCEFNRTHCTGAQGYPKGDECMRDCGNFAGCQCRGRKGTLLPDHCQGNTVLREPKSENSTRNWTCAHDIPKKCMNHIAEGVGCNKYRLCPADLCMIKKVKCPPLDQCTMPGYCAKFEGRCYYSNVPDGKVCNDGLPFTVNDTCKRGYCSGILDMCVKYNVTCPSLSACTLKGVCDSPTGRCSYTTVADDYPCSDGRDFTVEDRCQSGFCLGREIDLCYEKRVDCDEKIPNECHDPGICEPRTGKCSLPVPKSNRTCDDRDPTTVNDTRIDGLCMGYADVDWRDQRFETLGHGQCSDRNGRQMQSYAGDVKDELECEGICRGDRQCIAFTFSPPICSVFGAIRTQPPSGDGRNWAWQGGTVPLAVIIEKAISVKGQRESVCRKKDEFGDRVLGKATGTVEINYLFSKMFMVVFFLMMMLIFCVGPIFRCFRTCFCGPSRAIIEETRLQMEKDMWSDEDDLAAPGPTSLRQLARTMSQGGLTDGVAPDSPEYPRQPRDLLPPDSPTAVTEYLSDPDSPGRSSSQALSPLTLPPSPGRERGVPVSPSDDGCAMLDSPKGWQRPVGKQVRRAWGDKEKREGTRDGKIDLTGMTNGPKIAPASVANTANAAMGNIGRGLAGV